MSEFRPEFAPNSGSDPAHALQIGAIGCCFDGKIVLDLARIGAAEADAGGAAAFLGERLSEG